MPDGVVLFDNHWKACTCDEYLSGIKAVRYRSVRKKGLLQQQRMIQVSFLAMSSPLPLETVPLGSQLRSF